jgi:hypothetical protein
MMQQFSATIAASSSVILRFVEKFGLNGIAEAMP